MEAVVFAQNAGEHGAEKGANIHADVEDGEATVSTGVGLAVERSDEHRGVGLKAARANSN